MTYSHPYIICHLFEGVDGLFLSRNQTKAATAATGTFAKHGRKVTSLIDTVSTADGVGVDGLVDGMTSVFRCVTPHNNQSVPALSENVKKPRNVSWTADLDENSPGTMAKMPARATAPDADVSPRKIGTPCTNQSSMNLSETPKTANRAELAA